MADREPETPTERARIWEEQRHDRLVKLMRMRGDTNRLETRTYICYAVAGTLALLALALGALS